MKLQTLTLLMALLPAGSALPAHEEVPHWITLFDGTSLDGWTWAKSGRKGKWKLEDGGMTQVDMVDYCTREEFEDFFLEVEFRSLPTGHGNSGVYLRGQYEVQIFNSTHGKKVSDLSPADGGGIYGKAPPLANPHKKQGEWNTYGILMQGNVITVWINGVLVQDSVAVDGRTGGAMSKSRRSGHEGEALTPHRGPIMVQGDHDKMWFRNIRLLSLPKGFKPLWNGKDLSEFTMRNADRDKKLTEFWKIDGLSFYNPRWGYEGERGWDLWTKKKYGNFIVHYEYRSDPTKHDGNSGFYLRNQWEIQIEKRRSTQNKHGDGALYSKKAPGVAVPGKPTDWRVMDVRVEGMKIWVWQNGTLIHDGVTLDTRTDNHGVPTLEFSKDAFKLQGDHGQVWFRNLYIKELPEKKRGSI